MQQKDPGKDPLAEKLLESGIAYKGSFLQLHRDTVKTPDGVVTTREYLHHPGASMIIPMLEDGSVILERQYRHPLRRNFLEFPAGKLNPGESPYNCAKRELIEETGYEAQFWKKLGRFNNAIGYSDFFCVLRKFSSLKAPTMVLTSVISPLRHCLRTSGKGNVMTSRTSPASKFCPTYFRSLA